MGQVSNLLARCIDATGSLPAAVLLYRICYWHPHAKIERGGRKWIAKSREEWMQETGLSRHQYNEAIVRLKTVSMISVEQHFFGRRSITHIALSASGEAIRHPGNLTPGCPVLRTPGCPPERTAQDHKGDTDKEIQQGISYGDAGASGEKEQKGDTGNVKSHEAGKAKDMVTVKDVLLGAGKKAAAPKEPNSVAALQHTWRTVVSEVYGSYVPPFTMKQVGQLKHFLKACPEGKATAVMETAVRDWAGFVGHVKSQAGINQVPAAPSVDFLVKHVGHAVDFSTPKQAQPEAVKPKATQSVQLTAPQEEPKKPSIDEVMAILNADD